MPRKWAAVTGRLTLAVLAAGWCGLALALEWNLQPAASKMAEDIHWLHELVTILCVVIFVGVFGFMFWSVYAHRKSVGHKAAQWHENTTVEILWTVIPFVILVALAIPVTKVVVAQKDTSNADITVKVTVEGPALAPLRGKWVMLMFDTPECDPWCERKLYFMRQVRRAQGKDQLRVERAWVLTAAGVPRNELLAAIDETRVLPPQGTRFPRAVPVRRLARGPHLCRRSAGQPYDALPRAIRIRRA